MVAKENWKREQANVLLYIQIDYNKPFVLGEIQNAAVFDPSPTLTWWTQVNI